VLPLFTIQANLEQLNDYTTQSLANRLLPLTLPKLKPNHIPMTLAVLPRTHSHTNISYQLQKMLEIEWQFIHHYEGIW